MKMVYKYPINEFPYDDILIENGKRGKKEPEYELFDTGIFDNDEYFDIFIEYCKADHNDILARVTICNRSQHDAPIVVAPTVWFRNNWKWGYNTYKAELSASHDGSITIVHDSISIKKLYSRNTNAETAFCDNETNTSKLYGAPVVENTYFKDGINNFITHQTNTINPEKKEQSLFPYR